MHTYVRTYTCMYINRPYIYFCVCVISTVVLYTLICVFLAWVLYTWALKILVFILTRSWLNFKWPRLALYLKAVLWRTSLGPTARTFHIRTLLLEVAKSKSRSPDGSQSLPQLQHRSVPWLPYQTKTFDLGIWENFNYTSSTVTEAYNASFLR